MLKNEELILKKGMKCLRENLDLIEFEIFIAALLKNTYDYTKWRQGYFENSYKSGEGSQLENFVRAAAANDPCEKSFGIEEQGIK
jgi:hypothetical protein